MFPIRIALGMKNVCFVYIFKHTIEVDLNLEIGINICVIDNPDKFEKYTVNEPSDVLSKIIGALAPTIC
jgi:hypothetical protein